MEILQLDVRTLAFVSSLGGALMAIAMAGLYLAGTRDRALLYWAASGLAFFLGYLLGVLLLTIPEVLPVWFSVALANALFGASHGLLLLGTQRYLDRPRWVWTVAAVVVAMFLVMFLVPELRESLRARIIVISAGYVVMDVVAGVLLWRARRRGLTPYRRAVALVLLSFAAFLGLRLGYALVSPALTTSFVQDPFQMAAFLINMTFCFAITIALALMVFRGKEIELRWLARRDPLTGLYNRFSLGEHARREIKRSERYGAELSVMMLDIDHFKEVNDRYGHAAGDAVLEAVAAHLKNAMRAADLAFRMGGEEFLVMLPCTGLEQAGETAERLRHAFADSPVRVSGERISVTASFGVVQLRAGREDWESLLKRADEALYRAKHEGRDTVMLENTTSERRAAV